MSRTVIPTVESGPSPASSGALELDQPGASAGLPLIRELCNRLIENRVEYCHWKSNAALHLSASGENDLDLLIDREHADKFAKILDSLGFKAAIGPASRELPGIRHYYGYDWEADEFVHVHAHYQLTVGHDTTKNYRIPVERPYIRSSHQQDLFRLPQPEFELVLFVVRMVLKHCPLDSLLFRESRLTQTENTELKYLTKRSDPGVLEAILNEHLPYLSRENFWQCRGAIEPEAGVMARLNAAQVLFRVLEPRARRHRQIDAVARVATRLMKRVPTPFLDHGRKKRFLNGGRLIAFIGGDGSGKSTAVAETAKWLIRHFDVTTVHLGKPSPSLSTIVLKGLLTLLSKCGIVSLAGPGPDEILAERSGRPCGLAWVILQVLIARDRRRLYHHALRSASNGRIVITDRFPLREIRSMDGVKAGKVVDGRHGGWMLSRLVEYEQRCYDQITPPDLAYVLRIDPEVALRRRADENPRFVRTRNREIHRKHWISPGVKQIDAAATIDQVIRQIKRTLWHEL